MGEITEENLKNISEGILCERCGKSIKEPPGHPVVCQECYNLLIGNTLDKWLKEDDEDN